MNDEELLGYGTTWGRIGGLVHISRVTQTGNGWYRAIPICGGIRAVVYPGYMPHMSAKDAKDIELKERYSRRPCPRCVKRAPRAGVAA